MKKIAIKYLPVALCLAALVQTGCNKALDLKPLTEVSDADYWKTPDQFKLAANEFYTYERTFTDVMVDNPHSELRSDFMTGSSRNIYSNGTNTLTVTDGSFNTGYTRLRSINYLLSKAAAYPAPGDISKYIAEAKFFRAYVYFDLMQQFGAVPLVTTPLGVDSVALYSGRTSRDSIADFIIKDLDEAIAVLPVESAIVAVDKGRVSKGAAQAFEARVALYEGTWQKFRGNTARANTLLDKAITASDAVITSTQYGLFGTTAATTVLGDSAQKYMFILENQKSNPASITKAANTEYILANRYDQTLRQVRFNITQTVLGNGGVNWPTRKLANMYLCQDGLPIEKSSLFQGYAQTRSEYVNRDNRMRYSLMIDSNYYWDNKAVSSRVTWLSDAADIAHSQGRRNSAFGTGYHNQKWGAERLVTDQEESYDYPVIRYAEVLLTYAEAKYERNGSITDADLDRSLNLVRNRVNKTMPKLSNALVTANTLDMRTEIRRERSIELYYEGFRLDDLKRWKTAEIEMPLPLQGITWTGTRWQTRWTAISASIVNGIYQVEGGRTWNERNYLNPIPTSQIALNPKLGQNPNW